MLVIARRPVGGRNLPAVAAAPITTFPNGWPARSVFAFDAGTLAGTVGAAQLLLRLDDDQAAWVSYGGIVPEGTLDLRAETLDGVVLAHEVVPGTHDPAAGRAHVVVRLADVVAGVGAVALYYGRVADDPYDAAAAAAAVWSGAVLRSYGADLELLTVAGDAFAADLEATTATPLGHGGDFDGTVDLVVSPLEPIVLPAHTLLAVWSADVGSTNKGPIAAGDTTNDRNAAFGVRDSAAAGFQGGALTPLIYTMQAGARIHRYESAGGRTQIPGQRAVVVGGSIGNPLRMWVDGVLDSASFQGDPDDHAILNIPSAMTIAAPVRLGHGPRATAGGAADGLLDGTVSVAALYASAPTADLALLLCRWWGDHAAHCFPSAAEPADAPRTVWLAGDELAAATEAGVPVDIDCLARAVGTGLEIEAISTPANGTASEITPGVVRYTPGGSPPASVDFDVTIGDGADSRVLTVTVAIDAGEAPEEPTWNVVNVSTAGGLLSALAGANPLDDIVLANGSYSGAFVLSRDGTEVGPIRIRAANAHLAILTSRIELSGKWGIVSQLQFNGVSQAVRINGEDCRVTRCKFNNTSSAAVALMPTCRRPQVDYNYIENYDFRGISGEANTTNYPRDPWIHHNHLKNQVSTNGGGIIMGQAGAHTNHMIRAIVEYNLVDGFNGIEPLSAKSSGNIFRFNTVKNAEGVIMCRHGTYNDYIGNASINAGGVMLHGRWNRAIGNYHDGQKTGGWRSHNAASGTVSQSEIQSSGGGSVYPRAEDCLFAGNIGPLILGGGNSSSSLPPLRTMMEENAGPVTTLRHSGTINRPLTVAVPAYVILTTADVGPAADL